MLRGINALPAEKGGKLRFQVPIDPALSFELIDILALDIFVVVERPYIERDYGSLIYEYWGPAV